MTALLDTNVIVRHLTQEPADQGRAATRFLADAASLLLTDVVAAETVYVLQSVYKTPRPVIAAALRALLSMKSVSSERGQVVRRGLDLYEAERMDFTDAYLVAAAEAGGIATIVSFDRGINKGLRQASPVRRFDPKSSSEVIQ